MGAWGPIPPGGGAEGGAVAGFPPPPTKVPSRRTWACQWVHWPAKKCTSTTWWPLLIERRSGARRGPKKMVAACERPCTKRRKQPPWWPLLIERRSGARRGPKKMVPACERPCFKRRMHLSIAGSAKIKTQVVSPGSSKESALLFDDEQAATAKKLRIVRD